MKEELCKQCKLKKRIKELEEQVEFYKQIIDISTGADVFKVLKEE